MSNRRKMPPTAVGAERFFLRLLQFRWLIIAAALGAIGLMGSQLGKLTKDTTPEAFVPDASPALAFRDHVEDVFGLKDPMVIAIVDDGRYGVYTPGNIALLQWLTDQVRTIEGVDPDRVTSLATENNIVGTADGMLVEPFWEAIPETQAQADAIASQVQGFPLLNGTLVARDGSATLIIAELLSEQDAEAIYFKLLNLTEQADREGLVPAGASLHVAGQGAVSGYLSAYIDADASRLNPIAAILITIVLIIAYRTLAGALLPNLIVVGTAAVGLGSMAAAGVPMYVITNSLPVILIGIAVCDSIHIFSQYYEEVANNPKLQGREAVARAMAVMWRPVTLTTLTTVAGFMGLAAAAGLPPMQSYGVFAAIGIAAAWLWTLTLLPALLSLLSPKPSGALKPRSTGRPDAFTRLMELAGRAVASAPATTLWIVTGLFVLALIGVSRVEFNDQRIHAFEVSEPLRVADTEINQRLDGTYYLDVAITTPNPEDLFLPDNLARIEALQAWMQAEGGFANTTSIVDYIKEMHQSVNADDPAFYALPDDPFLIAQYFLLYTASGEPTDFEEVVDYDYRLAHVRGQLQSDNFRQIEPVVLGLKSYLADTFNNEAIQGVSTGALDLSYSWMAPLGTNTAQGMALALGLVLLASVVFFRSVMLGVLATLPVAFAVLMVFAVMGYTGIWIGVGTSMFAAIAIGLGVDFAIHSLDRLRSLIRDERLDYADAVVALFTTTGRALLFNLLALALGFGVLMTSKVPPLQDFGLLVAIAVTTSFVISLTAMPALISVLKPKALFGANRADSSKPVSVANLLLPWLLVGVGLVGVSTQSSAQDADQIMAGVDQRPEGQTLRSHITLKLTDRRGRTREQQTVSLRKYYGEDKRQVLYYLEPTNVRDTAFLTHDYASPDREDDQWLYLPALRKTRRISASDRGDYFLGTDLTYEDLKRQNKVSLDDWRFSHAGMDRIGSVDVHVVEGVPVSQAVAEELGYARARWYVDSETHTIRKSDNWDTQGNLLKTAWFDALRQVDGIWTVHNIRVENHKTGHQTELIVSDVVYDLELDDGVFEERSLRRGYRP